MNELKTALLVVALSLAATRVAHADTTAVDAESTAIGTFAANVDMMHKKGIATPSSYTHAAPSKCTDVIAKHRADLKADDVLTSLSFKNWPGAIAGSGNSFSIPAGKAQAVCDAYTQLHDAIVAMQKYPLAKDYAATRHTMDAKDYNRTMDVRDDKAGQKCLDDVAAAIKDGAPHDVAVNFGDGEITLDQLSDSCKQHIGDNKQAVATVKADMTAQNAEVAAAYQKVGIKGDRLKLFTDAGKPAESGFYFAGCSKGPTTAAEMKKAKKLFTWSEGDKGIIVTRYVFKGDKFTSSARTFSRKDKAYAGCR